MPHAEIEDKISQAANRTDWPDVYTSEHRMQVRSILAMMATAGLSQRQLGKLAGISASSVNLVLSGTYNKNGLDKFLSAMREALDVYLGHDLDLGEWNEAQASLEPIDAPFVETSVYRAVVAACYRARRYGGFAVVSAFVGTGKTTALQRVAEQQEGVYLIHGLPSLTHSVMLDELIEQIGVPVKSASAKTGGTKAEKLRAIIGALKGQQALILLDEAETCSSSSLEYIRRIRDLAGAGVVLCGTERLMPMVRDPRGRFGQISSRVLFWPPIIKRCSTDDLHALARACMPEVDFDEPLLEALEMACDGSARVLCDGVLPGLRDYVLNKGKELTPQLIKKISRDLLGFTPARRKA